MPRMRIRSSFVALVLLTVAGRSGAGPAPVELRLAAVFTDHAVLQRDRPLPVWGTSEPGDAVTVTFAGKTAKATADASGRFLATLEALPAGGPYELVAEGRARAIARDVLVGEVWLASGQSNMAMTVGGVRDADAEAAAATLPSIRMFTSAMRPSGEPEADVRGAWVVADPATVKGFSAAAWFFAREIHKALSVPVGLVVSSVGGTVAEAWTPAEAVAKEPLLAPMWEKAQKATVGYDRVAAEAKWRKAHKKWKDEAESDRRAGRNPPPEPPPVSDPRAGLLYPGSLWNGMVAPLAGLSLRGFLWYQGESNAPRAEQYRALFPTLIRSWRAAWGREDLPFYFCQLANFGKVSPSGVDSPWAELRDAQLLTMQQTPFTGMAVLVDIGEAADIHPKNKQEVGRRLALWALAKDYGRGDTLCSGPLLKGQTVEGGKLVLTFDRVGTGLATSDGRDPEGFAVASAKGVFMPARAKIEGDRVILTCPKVPHPTQVRYAWAESPEAATLTDSSGLPASPFRTDARPGVTDGKN